MYYYLILPLNKMLDMRVIDQSHRDWYSPIVLVPKPDGVSPILYGLPKGTF